MGPNDVLTWRNAAPFRPFRIYLVSARSYEIRHPEMLRVGRSSVNVYTFTGEPADPYEHMEMVSLVLIERIEPVETAARG